MDRTLEPNFRSERRQVPIAQVNHRQALALTCRPQHEEQLRGLSPERRFVAVQEIEGAVSDAADPNEARGKPLRVFGAQLQDPITIAAVEAVVDAGARP